MVRVGLTGGLGSGKTAVGLVFAEGGAHVFSADALGRALMQPGQAVFVEIVERFGPAILAGDGTLDRRALAEQAFRHGRLAELNAIVHPAVFRAQEEQMRAVAAEDPDGIAVIESALIFEVDRKAGDEAALLPGGAWAQDPEQNGSQAGPPADDAGAAAWRRRFDRLVLVTAPDELRIARYVARVVPPGAGAEARQQAEEDARARLAAQMPDAAKAPFCDYIIENNSTLVLLRRRALEVLAALRRQ